MSDVRVRFYERELKRLLVEPQGPVGRELARYGLRIESAAKALCSNQLVNVRTGRLRASIRWAPPGDGFTQAVVTEPTTVCLVVQASTGAYIVVGSDVEYSWYVHEGTVNMEGRPFLTRAVQAG